MWDVTLARRKISAATWYTQKVSEADLSAGQNSVAAGCR
jgi:hypothetical protein